MLTDGCGLTADSFKRTKPPGFGMPSGFSEVLCAI